MTDHREFLVGERDAESFADAVLRYELRRWQAWAPLVLMLLAFAVIAGHGSAGRSAALGAGAITVVAIAFPIASLVRRDRIESILADRGYRLGARLQTEFEDGRFVLTTEFGPSVHLYREISDARVVRGVVLLRVRPVRTVLALPHELVPDSRLDALLALP